MHGHRSSESYSRPCKTETKLIIGKLSKEKFTEEYNKRIRKIMEDRGHWMPLSEKNDYEIYFSESDWITRMYDIIDKKYYLDNDKKLVRDHLVPRWYGYKIGLYPEILRHPCNCRIISHSNNIKKGFSDRKKSNEELLDLVNNLLLDIENYEGVWLEQNETLEKIKLYKENILWKRKELIV